MKDRSSPIGLARALGLVAALLLLAALPARAQDLLRIAAVVNDDAISLYDVAARIDSIVATTGLADTPAMRRRLAPQVLRALINERLQLQEAKRLGITVSDQEMRRAVATIEKDNRMPPGGFERFLRANGLSRNSIFEQIRAGIAWTKIVSRRLSPQVRVSDEEVDEVIARIKAHRGRPEFHVFEIFLAVDSAAKDREVREAADSLIQQLRHGVPFDALARQFSQSATAAVGGDVGWVTEGQLPAQLDRVIRKLSAGEISDPIQTPDGYYILSVRERRTAYAADPRKTKLRLTQIFLPAARDADAQTVDVQRRLAKMVHDTATSCKDMTRLAKELRAPSSGDVGWVTLADMPPGIREAVSDIAPGVPTAPVRTDAGFHVLMVCERKGDEAAPTPDRDKIADRIGRQRLELLARRYLRDLRRAAFIDIRL